MGIIQEIQEDLLKDNIPLSKLLNKSYIPAVQLNLTDFKNWLDKEIQGYNENDIVPEYRKIKGVCQGFNIAFGWKLINFMSDIPTELNTYSYRNSIFELEEFLKQNSLMQFQTPISPSLISKYQITNCTNLSLLYPRRKLLNIINGAKGLLMSYIAKLNEVGIMGNGNNFTKDEKNKAQTIVNQTINVSGGHFMNQVATENSTQIQNNGLDIEQVKDVYELIEGNINKFNLTEEKYNLLKSELDTLKAELDKDLQNPSLIQRCLNSIKNIIEGATESIVGETIMHSLRLLGC